MTGFAILAGTHNLGAKYFACFLITSGIYPNVPQGVAWNGNNIGGSLKRGVGIAMHVGFVSCPRRIVKLSLLLTNVQGNLGGVISAFIFLPKDASQGYRPGHLILLSTTGMSCVLSILMTLYLRRENRRRDAQHKAPEAYTRDEKIVEQEDGDNATFYRYTV